MAHKILIIGAGASGLMAAHELTRNNQDVVVIEARDRVGGRIHTKESTLSLPIEMGAEFMHGRQPETLLLIGKSKSKTSLLAGNRYQLRNGDLEAGDFFDARTLLRTPIKDTIYFAGEALYEGAAMGTVEAALVNGKEVSRLVRGHSPEYIT